MSLSIVIPVYNEDKLLDITIKKIHKIIHISWKGRKIGVSKFKISEQGSMQIFTLLYCLIEKILLKKR